MEVLYFMISVAQNSETCLHGSKCFVERSSRSIGSPDRPKYKIFR